MASSKQGRRVTILDVAEEAGVSKSTASRALLRTGRVSPATVKKVNQVAARLGYVRDRRAIELAGYGTKTLGMMVRGVSGPFYSEVLTRVQECVDAQDIELLIVNGGDTYDSQTRSLRLLAERKVDGIIVANGRIDPKALSEFAVVTPIVAVGVDLRMENLDTVVIDPASERFLAERVMDMGHTRVAVSRPVFGRSIILDQRFERMRKALKTHGCDVLYLDFDGVSISNRKTMLRHIVDSNATAIMAGDDMQMIEIIEMLRRCGVEVPSGMSVTGFDGVGSINSDLFGLTTWRQPVEKLASLSVDCLLDKLANPHRQARYATVAGSFIAGRTLGECAASPLLPS